MNRTMVIGLSVLLCLYLAFGLGCTMYDEGGQEACEGSCITKYFEKHRWF